MGAIKRGHVQFERKIKIETPTERLIEMVSHRGMCFVGTIGSVKQGVRR